MGAIDRIKKYIDYKGISKYRFYKDTGLSNGFLDKNENIGSDKCEIIIDSYPDLSLEWIITGRGDMLKNGGESLLSDASSTKNKPSKMGGEFGEEMGGRDKKGLFQTSSRDSQQNKIESVDCDNLSGKETIKKQFKNSFNIHQPGEPSNETDYILMRKEMSIFEHLKQVNNVSKLYDYVGDFEGDLFMCHTYASYYYYGSINNDIKSFIMRQLSKDELLMRFKDNLDTVQELKRIIEPYKNILKQLYLDLEDFNQSHDNLYSLEEIEPKEDKNRVKSSKDLTSN